jgi:transcriptional regulator with XRE-family HTH domain
MPEPQDDRCSDDLADAVKFGLLVRERRTARGLSLEALAAEALGNLTRKGYVSEMENGRKRISPDTAKKIARALDIAKARDQH